MSDIIAMHKADLVNAIAEAVKPIKADLDALTSDKARLQMRIGELEAEVASFTSGLRETMRMLDAAEARAKALESDRDQISLTLAVAKADRDKWFSRAKALEAHIEKWVFVAALQTFEDRERFRTESEKLLYSAPETNAKPGPNAEGSLKIGKVHYSESDYECLAVALADLLKQVNKFCEEQGEAEFYTGNALAALGLSDNEVHIKTLSDLRSASDRGEKR